MNIRSVRVGIVLSLTAIGIGSTPAVAFDSTQAPDSTVQLDSPADAGAWIASEFSAVAVNVDQELREVEALTSSPDVLLQVDPELVPKTTADPEQTPGSVSDSEGALALPTIVVSGDTSGASLPADANEISIGIDGLSTQPMVNSEGLRVADIEGSSDFAAVQAKEDGVQTLRVIGDAQSPVAAEYSVNLPEGAVVYPIEDGSFVVEDSESNGLGVIQVPWATDAAGVAVPTHIEFEDGKLTQYVDHSSGDYQYPILADPYWTYSHTAIAVTGNGAWISGSESVARASRELNRCFNCSFPISGALADSHWEEPVST
ncbi:hypothetical protein [uncultured Arthrobacter sp.]|uniref:hypothetical protein n=1 Tax=uncultured Arthrobacter sp. TaxID=114050 RepID=UPI0025F2089D|nr:hypothetical protein [uncultured Arthrobacter sp.]